MTTGITRAVVLALIAGTIGVTAQAWDADLDTLAAVTPGATGLALLDDTTQAAARTTLALTPGTDVQAYDADLGDIAAIADAQGDVLIRGASGWERLAAGTAGQSLRSRGAGANPSWAYQTSGNPYRTDFVETFQGGSVTSGSVGDYGWNFSVAAGSMAALAPVANHPGLRRVTTAGTTSASTTLYKGAGGSTNAFWLASDVGHVDFVFRLNSVTATRIFVGMTDNGNPTTATEWYGCLYDSTSDTHWQTRTKTSGGTETVITDVTAVAGNWVLCSWDVGTDYVPSINGVAKTAHTVREPSTSVMLPAFFQDTLENVAKSYDPDTVIVNGDVYTAVWD